MRKREGKVFKDGGDDFHCTRPRFSSATSLVKKTIICCLLSCILYNVSMYLVSRDSRLDLLSAPLFNTAFLLQVAVYVRAYFFSKTALKLHFSAKSTFFYFKVLNFYFLLTWLIKFCIIWCLIIVLTWIFWKNCCNNAHHNFMCRYFKNICQNQCLISALTGLFLQWKAHTTLLFGEI